METVNTLRQRIKTAAGNTRTEIVRGEIGDCSYTYSICGM